MAQKWYNWSPERSQHDFDHECLLLLLGEFDANERALWRDELAKNDKVVTDGVEIPVQTAKLYTMRECDFCHIRYFYYLTKREEAAGKRNEGECSHCGTWNPPEGWDTA